MLLEQTHISNKKHKKGFLKKISKYMSVDTKNIETPILITQFNNDQLMANVTSVVSPYFITLFLIIL